MSIYWMNRIWELSEQKGSNLLTALAIADNANDSGVAWPGYQTLAGKTRLSERNVARIVEHLDASRELTIYRGGSGRRSTNIYVLLIGRTPEEIAGILKMLKGKHVNLDTLKGGQLVTLKGGQLVHLDNFSWTKKADKVDTAVSTEPSVTNGNDGWMDDDPICKFLRGLPGFNPVMLVDTRREIVAHHYELSELPYLWNECALGDNPIGLFTHRVSIGQHSVDWQMLQMQQEAEAQRKAADAAFNARIQEQLRARRDQADAPIVPAQQEPSLTQPLPGHTSLTPEMVWTSALGELQLEMTRATFDTWVKPVVLLSANGTWRLGAPNTYARDWLQNRLYSTISRILAGIVGQPVELEFITYTNQGN